MSVFHGNWNECPREFLTSYLQCTAASGDDFKARHFINYLGANSEADDWYDELPQDEKKDWAVIERSFRKKWLKEEVISISLEETVTNENEPQPVTVSTHPTSSIITTFASCIPVTTTHVVTDPNATQINPASLTATSQSLALSENTKMGEIPPKIIIFSSTTPSVTSSNSTTPSTTTMAPEIQSKTTIFTQKHENVEKSPIPTQTSPKITVPSTTGPINDVARGHTSLPTPKDGVLRPTRAPSSTTTATSPQPSAASGHEKSVLLRAIFRTQTPMESLASTTVTTALKTRSETAGFIKNHQKVEISPILTQNNPEPLVSSCLRREHVTKASPAPTTIVTALKTPSQSASFMENHQNIEKPSIFAQKPPEPLVLGSFSRADDTESSPVPTTTVTVFEMRSATAKFMKNHEKSPIFNHKLLKPPKTTSILIIRHPNIIPIDIPSSGKDPPYLQVDFGFLFSLFKFFAFVLATISYIHHTCLHFGHLVFFSFLLFLFSFVLFPGDEGVATLEGGTWSSASLCTPPSHIT
jgi:hypothetical protein